MRRSNHFSLYTISGVPYLLPFGQGIADLRRGIQINGTGAYLWGLLDRERTEDEMLSLYAAYYEVPASQLPELRTDLQQFLSMLDAYGMLEHSDAHGNLDGRSEANAAAVCNMPEPDAATVCPIPDPDTAAVCPIPDQVAATVCPIPDPDRVAVCPIPDQVATTVYPIPDKPASPDRVLEQNQNAADTVRRYLSVGGLTLLLCGPEKAFSRDFDAFEIFPAPAAPVNQTITVTLQMPAECATGRILLKNRELTVMENDLQYLFHFPSAPGIRQVCLTKDGTEACYYCCPPFTEAFRLDLFHAIRLSFLYLAQLHDMIVLHSASLLYRERAWLFSGHSGAGKSTHTNLWKELCHVPLINGDLNLLSVESGHPMVHGLPWCGTSGIVDTHSYPLGGILLIKKATHDHIVSLDDSHAQLLVSQRLISPTWTEALLQKNLHLVEALAPHILICRLHCTKTPEAVETARHAIDAYLADELLNTLP